MFRVLLHAADGEKKEYSTEIMQYAKRYADLYRNEYPYIEIIECTENGERVFETFGKKLD